MGKLEVVKSLCGKVAGSNWNVHYGWLCKRDDCEEALYGEYGSFEYLLFLLRFLLSFEELGNLRTSWETCFSKINLVYLLRFQNMPDRVFVVLEWRLNIQNDWCVQSKALESASLFRMTCYLDVLGLSHLCYVQNILVFAFLIMQFTLSLKFPQVMAENIELKMKKMKITNKLTYTSIYSHVSDNGNYFRSNWIQHIVHVFETISKCQVHTRWPQLVLNVEDCPLAIRWTLNILVSVVNISNSKSLPVGMEQKMAKFCKKMFLLPT